MIPTTLRHTITRYYGELKDGFSSNLKSAIAATDGNCITLFSFTFIDRLGASDDTPQKVICVYSSRKDGNNPKCVGAAIILFNSHVETEIAAINCLVTYMKTLYIDGLVEYMITYKEDGSEVLATIRSQIVALMDTIQKKD